jgi:hypothetical protein
MGAGIGFTRRPATGHYRRGRCLVTPILDSWISDLIMICAQTHFRVCREGFGTLAHPESATPPERNIIAWRRWSVTEAPEIPPAKVMSAKTMRRFNKIPARRGTCGQKPEARNLRPGTCGAVSEVDSRLPAPPSGRREETGRGQRAANRGGLNLPVLAVPVCATSARPRPTW